MTAMLTAPSPRPRSPAQIEAARRNGARSRGPATPEGKRRSSANALKHGLTALHHLVLEDEDPQELEGLTARLLGEIGAEGELEARLVRRLAVAFWKGERAERMEVALLDGAPDMKPPTRGGTWEEADAAETFDVKRFNAVRGHQAAQGREISRCLKELRLLRREPLTAENEPELQPRNEPEASLRNEPDEPALAPVPAANDDGPRHGMEPLSGAEEVVRNEPDASPATPAEPESLEALRQAIRAEVAAQTRAEEPDPERAMALIRRLSLEALRLGRTAPAAAA
jgi:hypothetical protein